MLIFRFERKQVLSLLRSLQSWTSPEQTSRVLVGHRVGVFCKNYPIFATYGAQRSDGGGDRMLASEYP